MFDLKKNNKLNWFSSPSEKTFLYDQTCVYLHSELFILMFGVEDTEVSVWWFLHIKEGPGLVFRLTACWCPSSFQWEPHSRLQRNRMCCSLLFWCLQSFIWEYRGVSCMPEGCLLRLIIVRSLKVTCICTHRKVIQIKVGYCVNSLESKQVSLTLLFVFYVSRVHSLVVEEIHFDTLDLLSV